KEGLGRTAVIDQSRTGEGKLLAGIILSSVGVEQKSVEDNQPVGTGVL
ncbi:hypothetical protein RvY_19377, partial [Ramazzottius varieornatus]